MKLVIYGPPGDEQPGLLIGEELAPLAPLLERVGGERRRDLTGVIRAWPAIVQAIGVEGLRHLVPRPRRNEELRLAPPLRSPGKIVGVGSNYLSAEGTPPEAPADSIFFFKPSSSLIGPAEAVVLPDGVRTVVGEVELAIVIGKAGWRVTESEAMQHVFGYSVANDITAPEILLGESQRNPLFLQAARAKGFPTFCPLGPWIVTADEIARPGELLLEQEIDGEIVAAGRASLMIRTVPRLVHEVSCAFGLEPGDVILSGSPRPGGGRTPLEHGNCLRSRIRGLGELENPVRRESTARLAGVSSEKTTSSVRY